MERELIRWLASEFNPPRYALLGIGDDGAILPGRGGDLVVTCDAICDNVHFRQDEHSPERIGRKALAVNLSDLAAMGARPRCATVSLVIPRRTSLEYVKRLYAGIKPLANRFQLDICGGDTTVWEGPLILSVSAVGEAPPGGCWRIDGAQPGDRILVTGQFGGSILGRHLDFEPRCTVADLWGDSGLVHACTDATDSLGLDLAKIAEASGVGFEIVAESIPVAEAAHQFAKARGKESPLSHALQDGEDFELVIAASPDDASRLLRDTPPEIPLTDIGEFTAARELWLVEDGVRHRFIPVGFEHQTSPSVP